MENAAVIIPFLVSIPAVVVAIVTAFTAKKTNAQWRERRAAKLATRAAASNVVPDAAAH